MELQEKSFELVRIFYKLSAHLNLGPFFLSDSVLRWVIGKNLAVVSIPVKWKYIAREIKSIEKL